MGIALSLKQYLEDRHVAFDCLSHRRTQDCLQSAAAGQISTDRMAKAVVLRHRDGYVMTVLPASRTVNIDDVGRLLEQPVALATENEITPLFPDCDRGAIPPLGAAYGMQTLVDEELDRQSDIYFEAGDHETLIHVSAAVFHELMRSEPHGKFCRKLDISRPHGTDYHGA